MRAKEPSRSRWQQFLPRMFGREAPFLIRVGRVKIEPQGPQVAIHRDQQHEGILLGGSWHHHQHPARAGRFDEHMPAGAG
jgi:hypothetical protein